MALIPSLPLILGAIAIALLGGRRERTISVAAAMLALAAAMVLSLDLPTETTIALWRPIELFGSGFVFTIDKSVEPFLLLGSVVVFAEALLDGRSAFRLLYAGLALAAIVGGNLFTIAMLWSGMILLETVHRLRVSNELDRVLRRAAVQFAAIAAVLASIALEQGAVVLVALAAVIRSAGGAEKRFPFSLAVLAPLGALASISRTSLEGSMLPWIAVGAIAIAMIQSLLYIPRFVSLALAAAAVGLLVPPEAQVLAWTSLAALLVATLGLGQAGGHRVAWIPVAVIPSAFLSGELDPGLVVGTTLAALALTIISRWLPLSGEKWPPGRAQAIAIAGLLGASVWAPLSSGWLPTSAGALAAGIGLTAGYVIARWWPTLSKALLPARSLVEQAQIALGMVTGILASSVRIIADVLEGESAVLWILLVILIIVVGLQVVIA